MDANFINPIIDAFTTVLPQLGITDISRKGVSVKGKYIESPGVVIIVGLVGDLKGNIIYALSVESAKKIASIMMMGMPVNEFDDLAQSAISELSNMLTATVATNYSMQNISVNISPPTLVHGQFTANAISEKVLCIEMIAGGTDISVNISLEKSID